MGTRLAVRRHTCTSRFSSVNKIYHKDKKKEEKLRDEVKYTDINSELKTARPTVKK